MSNQEEISNLYKQLDSTKQELADLQSSHLIPNKQRITNLQRRAADLEAEISSLSSSTPSSSERSQSFGENTQVGMAVTGDINAPISQEITFSRLIKNYIHISVSSPFYTKLFFTILLLVFSATSFLIYNIVIKPHIEVPDTSSWNIVVAGIGVKQVDGKVTKNVIGSQMSNRLADYLRSDNSRVVLDQNHWYVGTVLGDETDRIDQIKKIGENTNADIVIYGIIEGDERSASFIPSFYIPPTERSAIILGEEIVGETQFGTAIDFSPESDALPIELTTRLTALQLFLDGLSYYQAGQDRSGNLQTATHKFQESYQLLNQVDASDGNIRASAVISLFLGAIELQQGNSFAQAQAPDLGRANQHWNNALSYYEQAHISWPAYGRPYLGQGSTMYAQVLSVLELNGPLQKKVINRTSTIGECFTSTSNPDDHFATLQRILICYDQGLQSIDQAPDTFLDIKMALSKGSVYFVQAYYLREDTWHQAHREFNNVINLVDKDYPLFVQRLLAYAYARRALTLVTCAPNCGEQLPLTIMESYTLAIADYEQALEILNTPGVAAEGIDQRAIEAYTQTLEMLRTKLQQYN